MVSNERRNNSNHTKHNLKSNKRQDIAINSRVTISAPIKLKNSQLSKNSPYIDVYTIPRYHNTVLYKHSSSKREYITTYPFTRC